GMMVAGTMQDTTDLRAAVRGTRADIVILNEPATGAPRDRQELLYSRPHLGVLSITSDGRQSFLHKLRPVRIALGEVSPESLVQAIQSKRTAWARLNAGLVDKLGETTQL